MLAAYDRAEEAAAVTIAAVDPAADASNAQEDARASRTNTNVTAATRLDADARASPDHDTDMAPSHDQTASSPSAMPAPCGAQAYPASTTTAKAAPVLPSHSTSLPHAAFNGLRKPSLHIIPLHAIPMLSSPRSQSVSRLTRMHADLATSMKTDDADDAGLKNLMLAWYYAGYYTGVHDGERNSARHAQTVAEQREQGQQ